MGVFANFYKNVPLIQKYLRVSQSLDMQFVTTFEIYHYLEFHYFPEVVRLFFKARGGR
jgi:hypothetical protein